VELLQLSQVVIKPGVVEALLVTVCVLTEIVALLEGNAIHF
jgi:uncharacterized membrane protein